MPLRYNLVGKHKDDEKPIVIGTYDTSEEAQTAVDGASEHDPNNNWKFYIEEVSATATSPMSAEGKLENLEPHDQ